MPEKTARPSPWFPRSCRLAASFRMPESSLWGNLDGEGGWKLQKDRLTTLPVPSAFPRSKPPGNEFRPCLLRPAEEDPAGVYDRRLRMSFRRHLSEPYNPLKKKNEKQRSEFVVQRRNSVAYLLRNHQDFSANMLVPLFFVLFLLWIVGERAAFEKTYTAAGRKLWLDLPQRPNSPSKISFPHLLLKEIRYLNGLFFYFA